jgi:hypothetical protein
MTGAGFASGLIAFAVLLPSLPTPSGKTFMETRLCATGRTIRIELPGQDKPDPTTPMPCHAVCARDEDPVKRKKTPL